MRFQNYLLASAAFATIFLSSCKKDIAPESLAETAMISSDAVNDEVETAAPTYTSVVTNVNANVAGFWQAVPAKYSQTTKKYPFILFIHGIGELGTNISRMNCCGLPRHLSNKTFPASFKVDGQNHSFIVMAPQFKTRPSAADMQSVIDYAKKRFRIDETRIYVTGLSMGGGSTWDYSAVYGQNAAAIVPVCGGTKPNATNTKQIASKNLPFWALYSTKDAAVSAQWGRDFLSLINANNPTTKAHNKLTIWTDVDHNSTWGRAFDPKTKVDGFNIYEWLLRFKRGSSAAPAPSTPAPTTPAPTNPASGNKAPVAKTAPDQVVPADWNWFPRLNGNFSTDSDGWIAKFFWRQVSGPNTVSITNPNTGETTVKGWTVGTYVFRVAVTDNKGAVSYADQKVTIQGTSAGSSSGSGSGTSTPANTNPVAGNKPPVAKTRGDQTIPKSWNWVANLNANFSTDSDGWIAKFYWSQVSGPTTVSFANRNTGNTAISGLIVGTYVFRVAVTDNKGAVSYADVKYVITNN